ncbi:MAG: hypothetical protein ACHWZW_12305 [Spirulina sp.]
MTLPELPEDADSSPSAGTFAVEQAPTKSIDAVRKPAVIFCRDQPIKLIINSSPSTFVSPIKSIEFGVGL